MARTAELNVERLIDGKRLLMNIAERPASDDEYEILIRLIIELEKIIRITEKSRQARAAEVEPVCRVVKNDSASLCIINKCLNII